MDVKPATTAAKVPNEGSGAATTGLVEHRLSLRWQSNAEGDPAAEFGIAIASYLFGDDHEATATTSSGNIIEDLDLDEWVALVRDRGALRLDMRPARNQQLGKLGLLLEQTVGNGSASNGCSLTIATSSAAKRDPEIVWLQASLEYLSPLPILAVSLSDGRPSTEVFNNFVALAAHFGVPEMAELERANEESFEVVARWRFDGPIDGALGVYPFEDNALHLPVHGSIEPDAKPVCWITPLAGASVTTAEEERTTAEWEDQLSRILAEATPNCSAIAEHLGALSYSGVRLRVAPLAKTPRVNVMAPRLEGVTCVVAPEESSVCIGVDFDGNEEDVRRALLHGYAHVLLGHVRPGDEFGHWDTADTIQADQPHRRWDREVRERFTAWFEAPSDRQVESIDDCTPIEKAQLGVWRMIGEMLGQSRRLHKFAERYQKAAYQRQAAQRMVAMLEEYDGAMLCDGVGLGKTYVATTLMVHYANTWKEQHKGNPDAVRTDPYRITVLSPNSVVSTWRREAIAPLAAFGVPLSTVRVISHTKLSRISRASDLLRSGSRGNISDLEHLLLSDLVIVDEAHNFRSVSASRTKVLRDLLRLQPRKELRRRVALLTATPINNSLEDLRQQASLLFSRPLLLSDARTEDGYRRQALKDVSERCKKARSKRGPRGDVSALVIHGQTDARFSDAIEFRDDLDFGPNVQRIGDYLKEQDKKLRALQDEIRAAAAGHQPQAAKNDPVRIAEELLDRIVVQRSRALCKDIERQQGSNMELLFRPDQDVPEKLYYSDEYDGIKDVLARFLPLFDTPSARAERDTDATAKPLSLKVYMWYDVREGIKSVDESSSVVGLQRILVLKRLESSPVSFLITLLRLTVLHAHRLQQLQDLCRVVNDKKRTKSLKTEVDKLLAQNENEDLDKLRTLAVGDSSANARSGFMAALSKSYVSTRPAADTDDPPPQLSLFGEEEEGSPREEQLDRLWPLREMLLEDFATLLEVTPKLADIIFGRFNKSEWPQGFVTDGVEDSDWPKSPTWGLRLVKDAKLRSLVRRLLQARRGGQKAIVFTQFSDTIAYIESVLRACGRFTRDEWQLVASGLGLPNLKKDEITGLLEATATITGATEDREDAVNAFAPFYRVGPHPPETEQVGEVEETRLLDEWKRSWRFAIEHPHHVLISTDVLAEGVNLQDVSLLINFDVHWNPVRMIQRAGRIDRRLNPAIEKDSSFPELAALAQELGEPVPVYYFHDHPNEPALTVNLILPDELEVELQLRERIAVKTLAIDFTLGLEQGTGAEADWMEDYKYQGISSLNSFQKDRAIEQVAGYHERLARQFAARGILREWAPSLNGWFREQDADHGSPLLGRGVFGRQGTQQNTYTRCIKPQIADGVPWWIWSQKKPGASVLNFWLGLDGQTFPAATRVDLPWSENASVPVAAHHLLGAAQRLESAALSELRVAEIGRPLMQGITALSSGFLGTEADRRGIQVGGYFLLQLTSFSPEKTPSPERTAAGRRGLARACTVCGHAAAMHKCCGRCGASADGEAAIEERFGFRKMSDSRGQPYEVPQPWCRACRAAGPLSTQGKQVSE